MSILEGVRELPGVVSRMLPRPADIAISADGELTEFLVIAGEAIAAIQSSVALAASEVERRSSRDLGTVGLAQRNGFRDGAGLVQDLTGSSKQDAAKLLRLGAALETAEAVAPVDAEPSVASEPPTRDIAVLRAVPGSWDAPVGLALRNGWLSAAQADALTQGLKSPRGDGFVTAWRDAVLTLIEDCWTCHWNAEDVFKAATRLRGSLDARAMQAEARAREDARSLKRVVRRDGMVHYDLLLDPENDQRLWRPIATRLSPRLGGPRFRSEDEIAQAKLLEEDPRSNMQLAADTLVELVEAGAHRLGAAWFGPAEPHVAIVATTTELAKAKNTQSVLARHAAGDHGACPTPVDASAACPGPDVGIAWIDGSTAPVTALSALRAICDGGYSPQLFDETGQAIDVGKDQRFFTRRQRRALATRDGGCLWGDCDRPPDECEAHHRNPWSASPENHKSETRDGVLLCRRHHKLLHDFGAHIERRRSEYWLHWPGREPVLMRSKAGVRAELRVAGSVA